MTCPLLRAATFLPLGCSHPFLPIAAFILFVLPVLHITSAHQTRDLALMNSSRKNLLHCSHTETPVQQVHGLLSDGEDSTAGVLSVLCFVDLALHWVGSLFSAGSCSLCRNRFNTAFVSPWLAVGVMAPLHFTAFWHSDEVSSTFTRLGYEDISRVFLVFLITVAVISVEFLALLVLGGCKLSLCAHHSCARQWKGHGSSGGLSVSDIFVEGAAETLTSSAATEIIHILGVGQSSSSLSQHHVPR